MQHDHGIVLASGRIVEFFHLYYLMRGRTIRSACSQMKISKGR